MEKYKLQVSASNKAVLMRVAANLHQEGIHISPLKGLNPQTFNATLAKMIKNQKQRELIEQRSQAIRECKAKLTEIIADKPSIVVGPDDVPSRDIARGIISEILKNFPRDKNGHRFSDNYHSIAFIISVYSKPALEALHQLLDFPCNDAVILHFSDKISKFKDALTDISKVSDAAELAGLNACRIAIAVDAINLKLHFSDDGNTPARKSNSFLFLAMPLDDPSGKSRNVILHAYEDESGLISKDNSKDIFDIIENLKQKFHVSFIAHDGDQGYDEHDVITFEIWKDGKDFDDFCNILSDYLYKSKGTVFIIDLLHFAKNRRTALILKKLTVVPYYISSPSASRIMDVIKLCDALTDTTSLGKMRDNYPITLFSILTLKALCDNYCFPEIVFIAPIAFWLEAIRNECLDKPSRLQLLKLAFLFEYKFLQGCDLMDPELGINTNDRGKTAEYYFVSSKIAMIQACNAILLYYVELKHNDSLNFSHLSTMTLEHVNGQIRNACNGNDSFDMVKIFLSKFNVALGLMDKLNIDLHKKTRDFQGGITFDPKKCTTNLMLPPNVKEQDIVDALTKRCGWNSSVSSDLVHDFFDYITRLAEISSKIKIGKAIEMQLRGARIMSRYCQKTE